MTEAVRHLLTEGEDTAGAIVAARERTLQLRHADHDTHAPARSSAELCRRVLTVMLAEEY